MAAQKFFLLKLVLALNFCVLFGFWAYNIEVPLVGPHQVRQADTQIEAYYYCTEDPRIGYPHVATRNDTTGVAVGEFPLYSYIVGMACRGLGFWSEVTPKIIEAMFFFLAALSWGAFARRRWGKREHDWLFWLVVFVSTPLNIVYLSIPMPEATALAFLGGAAWLWTRPFKKAWACDLLGSISFCVGFMVRPYHVWLLFLTMPNFGVGAGVLAVCFAGFFGWYRLWAHEVTTLPGYFGINLESPAYIIEGLPRAIAAVPRRLMDQTLWIGLYPLWLGVKLEPLWGIGFVVSWGTMMLFKSRHLMAHPYYLMSSGVFASVLMFLGLRTLPYKRALAFGVIFVIASFITVQHHFRPGHEWPKLKPVIEEARREIPQEARVVTYCDQSPIWSYYIKRKGMQNHIDNFKGPKACPPGYDYFFRSTEDGGFTFAKCETP